jgi:hypothetical protein
MKSWMLGINELHTIGFHFFMNALMTKRERVNLPYECKNDYLCLPK